MPSEKEMKFPARDKMKKSDGIQIEINSKSARAHAYTAKAKHK